MVEQSASNSEHFGNRIYSSNACNAPTHSFANIQFKSRAGGIIFRKQDLCNNTHLFHVNILSRMHEGHVFLIESPKRLPEIAEKELILTYIIYGKTSHSLLEGRGYSEKSQPMGGIDVPNSFSHGFSRLFSLEYMTSKSQVQWMLGYEGKIPVHREKHCVNDASSESDIQIESLHACSGEICEKVILTYHFWDDNHRMRHS